MEKITNYDYGVNHSNFMPERPPLTEFNGTLEHYNKTSLNNFIRYGDYSPRREHNSKNKSIADILLLSEAECHVLYNFIEICRLNCELITGMKKKIHMDDLFFRLLVSIDNPPNELPMFYKTSPLSEDIFYYKLIMSLYKWLITYEKFCENNGVKKIKSNEIIDMNLFNGQLSKITLKVNTYLAKSKVIFDSLGGIDEKIEMPLERDEKMDSESIKNAVKSAMEEIQNLSGHHHKGEDSPFAPHKKHHYDFEESGFNVPTLIKSTSMIYCDKDLNKLIPKMDDNDILYLPKDSIVNGKFKFERMRNIKIVGQNTKINASFEFIDVSGSMENIIFHSFKDLEEDESYPAVIYDGKSKMKLEDCVFTGIEKGSILCPNIDTYAEIELILSDCIFNLTEEYSFITADSIEKLECYKCNFICNNSENGAVYVFHTNNSSSVIKFDDCNFLNNSTAIRLINNKISSRVGITKAYILNSKFNHNIVDLSIGKDGDERTNVNVIERYNSGLDNIEKNFGDDSTADVPKMDEQRSQLEQVSEQINTASRI